MKSRIALSTLAATALLSAFALTASAQVGAGLNASVNVSAPAAASLRSNADISANANADSRASSEDRADRKQTSIDQRMATLSHRGDIEIGNRISALTALQARIQGMKNLSDSQKASFAASVQAQIGIMNTLLAKIQADTSTTTLRADLETIAPSYRIYILIRPQLAILAAADRVGTVVGMLQTLSAKFDARLAAHADASASAKLADMKSKIADASVQASAATSLVVSLQPDNGNATIKASNDAAVKSARAKIKAASDDLKAAYADARSISGTLKASASVNSSTSTN